MNGLEDLMIMPMRTGQGSITGLINLRRKMRGKEKGLRMDYVGKEVFEVDDSFRWVVVDKSVSEGW